LFTHKTYYMGMVDERNHVNFYDGSLRVVAPDGHEWARFRTWEYANHIDEHTEPWTYMKFTHLKEFGWQGLAEGEGGGIYAVAPLARLNAAEGFSTPLASEEYLRYCGTLGGKPVHHTLANHWARLIELLHAAERMQQLANDEEITSPEIRARELAVPREGVGVVEAPRGTLIHHYQSDQRGVITKARLIVATQHNAARMAMSVEKAARGLVKNGSADAGILNMVEMAFRAYDPCLGCATHALPGYMPLAVTVRNASGVPVSALRRDGDGSVHRT
jgi:F420-non-reducing hydrogenase large subunit